VQDLIALNEQFEGDVNEIMIRAILRENEDEDKVVQIIKDAIEAGKTEEYSKFKSSLTAVQKLRRKKAADREKKQFSKGKNKKEKSPDIGELYQMILAKKEKRGSSFLDDLEARYCKPKKGKKETAPTDAEIDEIVKKNKQKEGGKTKKGNKSSNTEVIEIFEEDDQLGNSKVKRGKKGNKTSNLEVIEIFDENDQKPKARKSKRNSKSTNAEVIEIN
jgi:DnaJ family protein C protein 9